MEFHNNNNGFLDQMLDSNTCFGLINDPFDQNALLTTPTTFLETSPLSITSQTSSSFEDFSLPSIFDNSQTLNYPSFGQHFINPFVDQELLSNHNATLDHHMITSTNIKLESSPPFYDQDYYSMLPMLDDVQNSHFVNDVSNRVNPDMPYPLGVTGTDLEQPPGSFNIGKNGKVEGQPSKNLMAERRRRKRLNDRLSMLRSIVPKISKMDRTSILADTIDYMKELMEKIKHMQEEIEMDIINNNNTSSSFDQFQLMTTKSKEVFIRNSPKFEVERRQGDTRVEVWCSGKPELLISTISTLEALGLHIHQCVISCFNDFTMHASCSEEMEQRLILNSDDIKQALFRNAGYGGRCL